jgi:hypothetical protein
MGETKIKATISAMKVELEIENGIPVEFECECEEYQAIKANIQYSERDKKCRHIRQAEMYHYFRERVEVE